MTSPSTTPVTRRVLVCVSGMSPAIITETLYALITQAQPFVPDEIHVITTTAGRKKIGDFLLNDQEKGHFHRLLRDYPQPFAGKIPRFDESTIHCIAPKEAPDQKLKDIVTLEDNLIAAQTVYRVMHELKAVPGTQVHASVAGGRKSMSFYMGQAFSLLADATDVLSHVLVSEPFEHPGYGFFYLPPQPLDLTFNDPVTGKTYTANTAGTRIELAEMSALKLGPMLRAALPAAALEDFDATLNLAQGLLAPFEARLHIRTRGHKNQGMISMLGYDIELTPAMFVLLLLHAHAQHMCATGEIKRQNLKYDTPAVSTQDWQALAEACELDWKVNSTPNLTVSSKITGRCKPVVGDVAERLCVEADGKGRHRLTARAPTFNTEALTSSTLQALLKKMVTQMAK